MEGQSTGTGKAACAGMSFLVGTRRDLAALVRWPLVPVPSSTKTTHHLTFLGKQHDFMCLALPAFPA
jgi:hypothetical protein